MFEIAEIGHKLSKAAYHRKEPAVRTGLLEAQRALATSPVAPVILVSGAEGAGKEDVVNLLLEWTDARGVETHVMWDETDEERERPPFWRFWRVLPPKGKMAILFGSWYSEPIVDHAYQRIDDAELERRMRRIRDFERMLTEEGVPVVKFWLHLSKDAQRKRLKALKKNPLERWRVSKQTWKFFKKYDAFRRASEEALRLTSTGFAPWHIIEATDVRYRNLTVTTTVLNTLRESLDEASRRAKTRARVGHRKPKLPVPQEVNVLRELDLSLTLPAKRYGELLLKWQAKLGKVTRKLYDARRSMILVFEGPDAAGKGGAIRRLTYAMEPGLYQVNSVAAPTDEEAARPYLWRFWRQIPRLGHVAIYDRSWYGRVLVERIEGFAAPHEWQRAYTEINDFEAHLADFGTIVIKFWLTISAEEQLRRFKDRELTPYKQYKLTEEDWRNRAKWNAYEAAACDMFERTSTDHAPWVLVEGNDKHHARIKVLETVCKTLKHALKDHASK